MRDGRPMEIINTGDIVDGLMNNPLFAGLTQQRKKSAVTNILAKTLLCIKDTELESLRAVNRVLHREAMNDMVYMGGEAVEDHSRALRGLVLELMPILTARCRMIQNRTPDTSMCLMEVLESKNTLLMLL